MLQCGGAGLVAICRGYVDVLETILVVPQMPFILKKSQHRSYSRITGRIGKLRLYLRYRRAAQPIDDIHDLTFAPSKFPLCILCHHSLVVLCTRSVEGWIAAQATRPWQYIAR